MKKPKVSFVIRTKNEGRFIGRVLRLIQRQTYKNFEIIVVDSGSTDKTLRVVKRFPVRLIEIPQKEFGYSYALNLGIKEASGEYVCMVSGHSLPVTDTWLEDGVSVLEEENVAGISGYWHDFPLGYISRLLGRLAFFPEKDRRDNNPWLTNTNSLIKKKLWRKYPFDEKLKHCEDHDWAVEMLSRGYNIVKLKKFSVFHSHFLLGRPGHFQMLPTWKKWNKIVDKKTRPSKPNMRLGRGDQV